MSTIHEAHRWIWAPLLLSVASCTSLEDRWKAAQTAHTIEAYEAFLLGDPASEFTDKAYAQIEDLRYTSAREQNSVKGYEEFLERYPRGRRMEEAEDDLMRCCFQEACDSNTLASYLQFVKRYPTGELSAKAKAAARPMFKEYAEKRNEEKVYASFLRYYSSGADSDGLRTRLEALRFRRAKMEATREAYDAFLQAYPQGERSNEIRELGRPLFREHAKQKGTVAAYDEYLERFTSEDDHTWALEASQAARQRENALNLANTVLGMAPEVTMEIMDHQFQGFNKDSSATYARDLEIVKKLLADGADPKLYRVNGYKPPSAEPLGGGATVYSTGSPGKVVEAGRGGMTLLEFAAAAGLDDLAVLLRGHFKD